EHRLADLERVLSERPHDVVDQTFDDGQLRQFLRRLLGLVVTIVGCFALIACGAAAGRSLRRWGRRWLWFLFFLRLLADGLLRLLGWFGFWLACLQRLPA